MYMFWLCWVFCAVRGLFSSYVVEGYSLGCCAQDSHCGSFSCCGLRLWSTQASVVVAVYGLPSYPVAPESSRPGWNPAPALAGTLNHWTTKKSFISVSYLVLLMILILTQFCTLLQTSAGSRAFPNRAKFK